MSAVPASEHLVFFALRPWSETARLGFPRTSGATFAALAGRERFSRVTYVHFEPRWGTRVRVERISEHAAAVGLPRGLPLGRFAAVRWVDRRIQARLLARELDRERESPRLFWLYDFSHIPVAGRLGPGRCVVECLDDPVQVFAASRSRLAEIPALRAAALARADVVAAVDTSLLEGISDGSPRFTLAPNGIAPEFLAEAALPHPEPVELAGTPRPRLVVVAGEWSFEKRVDHELLASALDRLAGWTLVLVGVPEKPGPSLRALLRRPGVVAIGERAHRELVPLLLSCDVGAVPYRERGGRDVLKSYEYLACGLPVVLTADDPRPEPGSGVTKATGLEPFVAACLRLAREGLPERARVRELLRERSWDRRTDRLLDLLDAVRPLAS